MIIYFALKTQSLCHCYREVKIFNKKILITLIINNRKLIFI